VDFDKSVIDECSCVYLSVYVSMCLCICVSVCDSCWILTRESYMCIEMFMCVCMSVCPSVCAYVFLYEHICAHICVYARTCVLAYCTHDIYKD